MWKFRFLTVLASAAFLSATVALAITGSFVSERLPPAYMDQWLFQAFAMIMVLAIGACLFFSIGGTIPLLLSFLAIEKRESGNYGFKDNWFGRVLKDFYRNSSTKATFCYLYTSMALYGAVVILLVSVVISWVLFAIMDGFTGVEFYFSPSWAGFWAGLVTAFQAIGFVLIAAIVIFSGAKLIRLIGDKLHGTRAEEAYKKNICPTVEID